MEKQKKDEIRRGKPGAVAVSSKRSGTASLGVCAVSRLSNAPSRQIGKIQTASAKIFMWIPDFQIA